MYLVLIIIIFYLFIIFCSTGLIVIECVFIFLFLIFCFSSALNEYVSAMRNLASQLLEQIAKGLLIESGHALSSLITNENSDQILRLNHYPPCPCLKSGLTGFGEHTDPQLISILRSNSVEGLQFALRDGRWISAPPDPNSFFVIVGDSLQVYTIN